MTDHKTASLARYLNARGAFGPAFDAAGDRVYFVSNLAGRLGCWSVRRSQTGHWPEPLHLSADRVQQVVASPRPGRAVLGVDLGGNERTELFLLDPPGELPRQLTTTPERIHHVGAWHPDGRVLALSSNVRDERYFDVELLDVETGERQIVLAHDSANYGACFSPDGRQLLVLRVHSPSEHELVRLDLATGEAASLTPPVSARYLAPCWLSTGASIVLATDLERDFLTLATLDPATSEIARLVETTWDVEDLACSPDGRRVAYSLNVEGYSELRIRDLASGSETHALTPRGQWYEPGRSTASFSWSPDSRRVAGALTTPTGGPDIWLIDGHVGLAQRLTWSWDADLPPEALAEPELVHYPTFDGREIPALLFRPPRAARRPLPAVCYVHGGPESQLRPAFNPVIQSLVARGLVVFAPNVRGSTGYGRAYSHLDDVERRLDAVRDLEEGARWLAATGHADPARIGVMGASYGGYMVLAVLTEHPDLWAAGVDVVGIASFVTFLERTSPWRRRLREAEYGSLERDRDLLERISPLHHVDRIRAPLMVVHGANDPRVPVHEAEQIVESLRARGRPVEYLRYEDEGHGIAKLANRLDAYPRIADFLVAHLGR